jgi:hypothetical protein
MYTPPNHLGEGAQVDTLVLEGRVGPELEEGVEVVRALVEERQRDPLPVPARQAPELHLTIWGGEPSS